MSDPHRPRETAKRSARACVLCRKLKKTCLEGEGDKCVRCEQQRTECVHDRPASNHTSDAGLARLGQIEDRLFAQELKADAALERLNQITVTLSVVLTKINALGALSVSTPSQSQFPRPTPPADPPSVSSSNGLATLASLAPEPSMDRFASNLHTPIQALADAAERVSELQAVDEVDEHDEVEVEQDSSNEVKPNQERAHGQIEDERPRKRHRKGILVAPVLPDDLVAKKLVSEADARALVEFWLKDLHPFCAILDPKVETYETLRRSPFLFNVVLYTALRSQGGNQPPSEALCAAAEETRRFARDLVFETKPNLEVIQAVLMMACWHDDPYVLSGYAVRLALTGRLDKVWETLDACNGWTASDEQSRRLISQFRTFLYAVFLDFRHAYSSGRSLTLDSAAEALGEKADKLLDSPFAISADVRTVANLNLTLAQRIIIRDWPKLNTDIDSAISYIQEKQQLFREWQVRYDARLTAYEPDPMSWGRRSHLRQIKDATLFLICNVLKHALLNPVALQHPKLAQAAKEAMTAAAESIEIVLESGGYSESMKWTGYLSRVDLWFAATISLKLSAVSGKKLSKERFANLERIAHTLCQCSGSQRYALALRATIDHMSKAVTGEQSVPVSPIVSPAATPRHSHTYSAASTPAYSQPFSSSSLLQPPLANDVSLWSNWTPGLPNHLGPNSAPAPNPALLPGELEVDWVSLMNESNAGNGGVGLGQEWLAYAGLGGYVVDRGVGAQEDAMHAGMGMGMGTGRPGGWSL